MTPEVFFVTSMLRSHHEVWHYSDYYQHRLVLSGLTFHTNGITHCMLSCNWLLLHNIKAMRPIHILYIRSFFTSLMFGKTQFVSHVPIDKYLNNFQFVIWRIKLQWILFWWSYALFSLMYLYTVDWDCWIMGYAHI